MRRENHGFLVQNLVYLQNIGPMVCVIYSSGRSRVWSWPVRFEPDLDMLQRVDEVITWENGLELFDTLGMLINEGI